MILRNASSTVCIDLHLGGNGQIEINLAALVPGLRDDYTERVTVAIDVAEELAHLSEKLPENLYIFPLGEAETAQSVAVSPKTKRTLAKRKGSPAKDGSSQVREVGHDNFQRDSEAIEDVIREKIIPALYRLTGGALTNVILRVFFSLNGGMGGGAVELIVDLFSDALHRQTSAVVQVRLYPTGPQAYLGCGSRIVTNASACLHDLTEWIIDPLRHSKEVRSATLFELPQASPERRAEWIGFVHQTLKAKEYSRILDPLLSNVTADDDPYHVQLLRFASHHLLDVWADVARPIAATYVETLQRLEAIADQGYSSAIDNLQITISESPVARADLKALLKTLTQVDITPDDFLKLVATPAAFYEITVNGVIEGSGELNLSNANETFAMPPITTQQIVDRQKQFVAALGLLDKERRGLKSELARLQREQAKTEGRLRSKLCLLQPSSSVQRARSWLSSDEALLAAIAEAIIALRAVFDEAWLVGSELIAVNDTIEAVRVEQRHLQSKLARMRSVFAAFCYRDARTYSDTCVTAKPFDEVLAAVWHCDSKTPKTVVRQIILHAVAVVTHAGLAKCLGCPDARIESLGEALIHCDYAEICPPWGGDPRQRTDMLFHALPPLEETLFEQLKTYVVQRVPDRHLFMVEHVDAGITVLDMHHTNVNSRDEIFTAFYEHGLEQAKNAKNPELNFPNGLPE